MIHNRLIQIAKRKHNYLDRLLALENQRTALGRYLNKRIDQCEEIIEALKELL